MVILAALTEFDIDCISSCHVILLVLKSTIFEWKTCLSIQDLNSRIIENEMGIKKYLCLPYSFFDYQSIPTII